MVDSVSIWKLRGGIVFHSSIRKNILLGYVIILGISATGTLMGIALGNSYQREALKSQQMIQQEEAFLRELRLLVMENRVTQELATGLDDPAAFHQQSKVLLDRWRETRLMLRDYRPTDYAVEGVSEFVASYQTEVDSFSRQASGVVEDLSILARRHPDGLDGQELEQAQLLIVSLAKSPEYVRLIQATEVIALLAERTTIRKEAASDILQEAEILRERIILGGLILSFLAAVGSGIYVSKLIVDPVRELALTAEEIIESANFDLQLLDPLEGGWEVQSMTNSFNKLVRFVRFRMEELKALIQDLEVAKKEADSASQAKTLFLANMSHELRTPLHGIMGYAQILRRSPLPAEDLQGVEVIYKSGQHLLTLINEILELSKLEAGRLELNTDSFQLPFFLSGILDMFRLRCEEKGLELVYEFDERLSSWVIGDEKRLRQVLINLLGNSVKFTEHGSIKLCAKFCADLVDSEGFPRKVKVRFSVVDTGSGVDPSVAPNLFQSFTRGAEGTGLGLAISQRLVRLMGGEIQYHSTQEGSHFWFDIPLALAEEAMGLSANYLEGGVFQ